MSTGRGMSSEPASAASRIPASRELDSGRVRRHGHGSGHSIFRIPAMRPSLLTTLFSAVRGQAGGSN